MAKSTNYETPHWVAFSRIFSLQNILLINQFSNNFECQKLGFAKMQSYS